MMHRNEEELLIQSAVRQASLPKYVRDVQTQLDVDSTGAPAVWLYVIVADKEAKSPRFAEETLDLDEKLSNAVRESGINRWPYVRFRSVSEQRALAQEEN